MTCVLVYETGDSHLVTEEDAKGIRDAGSDTLDSETIASRPCIQTFL